LVDGILERHNVLELFVCVEERHREEGEKARERAVRTERGVGESGNNIQAAIVMAVAGEIQSILAPMP
jgi:hypothetical protein